MVQESPPSHMSMKSSERSIAADVLLYEFRKCEKKDRSYAT
ncbi:hypothetical protein HanRHA438_Chr16g0784961 [Helianthus annuus]|nr:hypothetical protein HanRHA438_Chr16g0784961 [Helianthus annuus]